MFFLKYTLFLTFVISGDICVLNHKRKIVEVGKPEPIKLDLNVICRCKNDPIRYLSSVVISKNIVNTECEGNIPHIKYKFNLDKAGDCYMIVSDISKPLLGGLDYFYDFTDPELRSSIKDPSTNFFKLDKLYFQLDQVSLDGLNYANICTKD